MGRSVETAYQYVPGNRLDPFQPFFEEAKASVPASECVGIPPGPLTEQEAPQFVLVAVVARGSEMVAMIQDRTGKGYLVRVGTFLGKKCGKVSGIDSQGVTVEEPYVDLLGQTKTRKVALGFKKTEGGRR
jgi:type IV pilus assembly protein PilP